MILPSTSNITSRVGGSAVGEAPMLWTAPMLEGFLMPGMTDTMTGQRAGKNGICETAMPTSIPQEGVD